MCHHLYSTLVLFTVKCDVIADFRHRKLILGSFDHNSFRHKCFSLYFPESPRHNTVFLDALCFEKCQFFQPRLQCVLYYCVWTQDWMSCYLRSAWAVMKFPNFAISHITKLHLCHAPVATPSFRLHSSKVNKLWILNSFSVVKIWWVGIIVVQFSVSGFWTVEKLFCFVNFGFVCVIYCWTTHRDSVDSVGVTHGVPHPCCSAQSANTVLGTHLL